MTPEQQAREKIDAQLLASGWVVQDYTKIDFSAGCGIALREVPLKSGTCDYLLLVDRKPVGVVEAKKKGTLLSGVAEQSGHYAENLPDFLAATVASSLPFLYESTGVETFFRDERDPDPRSRPVFSFHRPETLAGWFAEPDTVRTRLAKMPLDHPLIPSGAEGAMAGAASHMRQCQIEAITKLEESFADAHPRALIQMATGSGKTFAACAFTYRLIKYAGARRVLFLVDRSNLGRQATAEFQQFVTPDTGRKFTELYNVQHLTSNALDPVCRVTICTIQRLYSMLRGEELPEDAEEMSTYEISAADGRPKEVAYNPAIPIEMFDFVVTDECHRSIYNLWRQVLEYFDAFLIGLTATPSKQTIGFFNQNLVTEYNHERAVADGVNVGYEVYRIKTQVTEQGGKVEKGFYVDKRSKLDRSKRWEQLDEDLSYAAQDLDRSVVVPSQIRTVLQTFKDALFTELFPGRTLVPKTLIFCKDDSHAEDVVHICREVFGKGNDFAKKITYKTYNPETKRYEKSETLIQEFRTSPQLRIAVTVDMIATGTDIKPLECLLFLRDVRSRTYFEQMKGRGTRVLTPTDLQAVSGADARAKTHFIIVDAVGVCESDKTDSRPLEKQPTVKFDKLLLGVALGKRDEDTLTTLAGRLARLERELNHEDTKELKELTDGKTLGQLSAALLRSLDPDVIAEKATGKPGAAPQEVAPEKFEATKKQLIHEACAPFDKPALRDTLVKLKQQNEQTIDTVTADIVTHRGFDAAAKEKAANLLKSFRDYIEQHKAEITALQILYSRPYKQRLTEKMLKELEKKLRDNHAAWTEDRLWDAFATTAPGKVKGRSQAGRFADLVALVRFALEQQPMLAPFADSVSERFNEWLMDKAKAASQPSTLNSQPAAPFFTPEQLLWLNLIRDHIATTASIDPGDFDYAPFVQRGGLGKAHQLFGNDLNLILDELNLRLVA
jgi:type I restriction enzyme R subunit